MEATAVRILYNERAYDGTVKFNGSLLEMSVFTGEKNEDVFEFSIDAMTCTTTFKGLKKTEQTNQLPLNFMPVIIFNFFSQTGADFVTELYDEKNKTCSIMRDVENTSVCLEVSQKEDNLIYVLKIS